MKIQILAIGVLKNSPEKDLFNQYAKRLHFKPKIIEIDCKQHIKPSASAYQKFIDDKDFVISLDEKGQNFSSRSFAEKLDIVNQMGKKLHFLLVAPMEFLKK
jgi:23S rRNA (pseudouridine1915-N3)-methyltransferase